MPEIDLEPNRYRQVSGEELRRAKPAEPILTQHAPGILAVMFCAGFALWLFGVEWRAVVTGLFNWLWPN